MIPNLFKFIFFNFIFCLIKCQDEETETPFNLTRSHILVADGSMFFQAGFDKNITFQTRGTGKILINNANVAGLPSKEDYDKYFAKLKMLEENYEFLKPQYETIKSDLLEISKSQIELKETQKKLSGSLTDFEKSKENISKTLESDEESLNHAINKIVDLTEHLNIDACENYPCLNGGTCIPKIGDKFMCLCPKYFEGNKCENDVNECLFINGTDLACKNGGSCENTKYGYKCNCQGKFHGPLCQYEQAVCSQSTKLCGPHGHCISSSNSYSCKCDTGFKMIDEKTNPTCADIDECENNPCHPGVQCLNLDGSFQCNGCPKGYKMVGGQCYDINECEEHPNICAKHSKCINHQGSYECGKCEAGYSGDSRKQCIKDDPCSQNNCPESSTCIPTNHLLNSLYYCKCPENRALNYNRCTPMDYVGCRSSCQNNGVVEYDHYKHRCKCNCPVNYVGERCEKASPCFPNPCKNGKCQIREDHSAVCICDPLYFGKNCETMEGSNDNHLTADYGSFNFTSDSTNQIHFHRTFFVRNNENYILRINFTKFENMEKTLPGPTDCETTLGKLTLYNGPNQYHPVFATFCGESGGRLAPRLNQNITIPVSNALLEFKGHSTDFALNYEFIKRECGYTTEIVKPIVVPENTQNISCLWIIKAPKHEVVRINIPKIIMLSGNKFDCNQNSLEIHDGFYKDQLIAQICSNVDDTITSYVSKGSYMTISFNSRLIAASNENEKIKGFSLKFNFDQNLVDCDKTFENELTTMSFSGVIKSPSFGIEKYPPNSKCLLEIIGARKNETNDHLTIKLNFVTFDVKSRDDKCKEDYIQIQTDIFGETSRYCNDKNPPRPLVIQSSNALIEFVSDKLEEGEGFEVRFEVECLRKFTAKDGSIQTWNFPNGGKSGKCIYIIEAPKHKYISLKFNNVHLNIVQNEEDCFNYNVTGEEQNYVEFQGGLEHNGKSNHKYYCKKNNFNEGETMQFYSTEPLLVTVSSDGSEDFKGISFEYNIIDFSCGGYFSNETSHSFESPHYPSLYPNDVNCDYHINAENWATIRLSFEDFDLGVPEYRMVGSCVYDRVEIYEYNLDFEKDGKLLITYCHSGDKQPVQTNYKNMLVRLISTSKPPRARWNEHNLPRGFKAKFEYLPHVDCETHLTTSDGEIVFTNYDVKCVYHININHGSRVIFNKLSGSCNMIIYDGATKDSAILGTSYFDEPYSLKLNQLVTSTNHALVEVLGKNENCTLSYFSETGCGKTMTGTIGGVISSPGWPTKGLLSGRCEWTIKVADGNRIQFELDQMDQISSYDESHPYYGFCLDRSSQLRIYESPRFKSELIALFCVKTANSTPIVSKHNEINIKYIQFDSRILSGFSAKWKVKCDGILLTDMFGAIQSVLYPDGDSEYHCNWTIRAPIGNRITILVHDIDIPCEISYLEVSNLKDVGSKKLCNSHDSHEITSEHNILNINYYSGISGQFSLSYFTVGCVGDIKTPQNIIIYKKDIDEMYQKFECHYKISAPIGQKIKITFNHYGYLTPKEKCVYSNNTDFEGIAVFSGNSNQSGIPSQTICENKPNPIISQFHEVFIIMSFDVNSFKYSDELYLNATIEFIDAPEGCSHKYELTDDPITISSPNYPRIYPERTKCEWQFNVQPGYHIKLILEDFSIAHSDAKHLARQDLSIGYSCKVQNRVEDAHGVLTIIEGTKIMDRICNNTKNKEYEIFSNRSGIVFDGVRRLRFVDKNHTENKIGFQLTARRVCGGVVDASFEEQTMYIEMRDIKTCNVTIRNRIGDDTKIFARIASTDILSGQERTIWSQQFSDNYEIFDGDSLVSTYPLYITHPKPAVSSETMVVKINTIETHIHAAIKYRLNDFSCSSKTITEKTEKVWINLGNEKIDCEWTISTNAGSYVSFYVEDLQWSQTETCDSNFIEIRKNNKSGELIQRTCELQLVHWPPFKEQSLYVRLKYEPQEMQNTGLFVAEFNKRAGASGNEDTLPSVLTKPEFPTNYPIYYNIESKDTEKYLQFEISNLFLSESSYIEVYETVDTNDNYESETVHKNVQSNDQFIVPFSKATLKIKYGRNDDYQIKWKPVESDFMLSDSTEEFSDCGERTLQATWEWQYIESPVSHDYDYNEYEDGGDETVSGYANNLHCLWNLNHPMFTGVMLKFEKIDLKNENDCVEDFVTFESDIIKFGKEKYCRSSESFKKIEKKSANNFKIHFISDGEGTATGFKLGYKLMCSSSQMIPIGADYEYQLESPPFIGNETSESDCKWYIRSESSRNIIVEVQESNIGNGNCTNDFVFSIRTSYFDKPQNFCDLNDAENRTVTSKTNILHIGYELSPMKNKTFKLKLYEKTTECPSEPFRINSKHPSRTIYSPEYPGKIPHSTECEYMIQAPIGQTITLNFVELDLEREDPNDKDHDYLEVRDGPSKLSPLVGKYQGFHAPPYIISTGNWFYLRLHTNNKRMSQRFEIRAELAKCGGTIHVNERQNSTILKFPKDDKMFETPINCTWLIQSQNTHLIDYKFLSLSFLSFFDSEAHLFISDRNNTKLIIRGGTHEYERSSSNKLKITFTVQKTNTFQLCLRGACGFSMEFRLSKEKCGGIIDNDSGTITLPGYPGIILPNLDCQYVLSAGVGFVYRLKFKYTDEENDKPKCNKFLRLYNSFEMGVFYGGEMFCENSAVLTTRTDNGLLQYSDNGFHLRRTISEPFVIEYQKIPMRKEENHCTYLVEKNETHSWSNNDGNTTKTGYDDFCHFKVKKPNGTMTLKINFSQINQTYAWLQNDYVRLKSTSGPMLYNKYISGKTQLTNETEFVTINNEMDLYIGQKSSSYLNYTVKVDVEFQDCGGYLKDFDSGIITSPNYGPNKVYLANSRCQWVLEAPIGQRVAIKIEEMAIHHTEDCKEDRLTVGEGKESYINVLHYYCQRDRNNADETNRKSNDFDESYRTIVSKSRYLTIQWVTNGKTERSGWKLSYRFFNEDDSCIYHEPPRDRGIINFVRQTGDYLPNQQCYWDIQAPTGHHILLHFQFFHLEDSENCKNDQLLIAQKSHVGTHFYYFEMKSTETNQKVEKPLCGEITPKDIVTETSRLVLSFKSNQNIEKSGFIIEWKAVCGATYNSSQGTIISPHFPNGYQNEDRECEYIINAEETDIVTVAFAEIDMMPKDNDERNIECGSDYVELFGNDNIGVKFCHPYGKTRKYDGPVRIIFKTGKHRRLGDMKKHKGFKILFTKYKCGGNIYLEKDETRIIDSGYKIFREPLMCTWNINTTSGNALIAKIEMLTTSVNVVKFFDSFEKTKMIGILSEESNVRRRVRTITPQLAVELNSSYEHTGIVMSVTSKKLCYQLLNATEEIKTIIRPRDDNGDFLQFADCVWFINAPEYSVIRINITSTSEGQVSSNMNSKCTSEGLAIYDGEFETSPLLTRICHNQGYPNHELVSSDQVVRVSFISHDNITSDDFTISYALEPKGCNIELTAEEHIQNFTSTFSNDENDLRLTKRCAINLRANKLEALTINFQTMTFSDNADNNYLMVEDLGETTTYRGASRIYTQKDKILQYHSMTNYVKLTIVTEKKQQSMIDFTYELFDKCQHFLESNKMDFATIRNEEEPKNKTCVTKIGNFENPVESSKIFIYGHFVGQKTGNDSFFKLVDNSKVVEELPNDEIMSYVSEGNGFVELIRHGNNAAKFEGGFQIVESETNDTLILKETRSMWGYFTYKNSSKYTTQISTIRVPNGYLTHIRIMVLDIGFPPGDDCHTQDEYLKIEITDKPTEVLRNCPNDDIRPINIERGEDMVIKITLKIDRNITNVERKVSVLWIFSEHDY
ncbi:unnamed protein product [Caenorhabditis angaria]|uniref:Cubilin n=1 Tax=Caenorhabditis angaria TaxID=860376 RepID=A0A9P1N878_9PELO|nr:unnamed protein product [Caenorhabditis angaria]